LKSFTSIFIALILSGFCCVRAQTPDSLKKDPLSSIKFMYENDVFAEEDQYYTQGVLLEYKADFLKRSPFSKALIHFKNEHWVDEHGIALRQDVYTPKSILNKTIDLNDRPYAAVFYASQFLIAYNYSHKAKLTSKLDVGIIGSLGLGEQEQKWIHRSIGDVQPIGWENQVKNSFICNYSVFFEKAIIARSFIELSGTMNATAGILNDHYEAGAILKVGKLRSGFKPRERKKGMEIYATLQGSGRYILYNGIMQGVFYTKSPHTLSYDQLEKVVYRSHFGLTVALKKFSISYYKYNITKEIKKGLPHSWGSLQFVGWF
jgi:hypothetical protein